MPGGPAWSTPLEPAVRRACQSEKTSEDAMTTGTIKKIVADRGFGFITGEDGKDYFFHRDALDATLDFDRLVGGERVQFDPQANPRGPRAINIRLV
jgi:CspA family cold shock protein